MTARPSSSSLSPSSPGFEDELAKARQEIASLKATNASLRHRLRDSQSALSSPPTSFPHSVLQVSADRIIVHAQGHNVFSKHRHISELIGQPFLQQPRGLRRHRYFVEHALQGHFQHKVFAEKTKSYHFWYLPQVHFRKVTGVSIIGQVDMEPSAYEQLTEGGWLYDYATHTLVCAPEMLRLHDLEPAVHEDALAKILARVHREDADRVTLWFAQLSKQAPLLQEEIYRIHTRRGRVQHLALSATLHYDDEGHPTKVAGTVRKIPTPPKAPSFSPDQFDQLDLLNNANVAVLSIDFDWKLQYMNRCAAKMLGKKQKSSVGKPLQDVCAEAITPYCLEKNLKTALEHRRAVRFETYHAPRETWLEIQATPYEGGLSVFFNDIGRLKEMEQALRSLNHAKDQFFSILAHDLRSPFATIMSLTNLASTYGSDISQEDLQACMLRLHHVTQNTHKLLDNLLLWSKAQMNQLQCASQQIALRQTVEVCMELYREDAREKGLTLLNTVSETVAVWADQHMVETILRNLLHNAIKFTKNGTITVAAQVEDDYVAISVTDTGTGIAPDLLETLFNFDSLTTVRGTNGEKGSGLGLNLCNELVRKNGGSLQVSSQQGKGTAFTFSLPLRAATA
ncbi:PAS fold-containing protein [Catalinimonas alkaloidigena]|uniref:histidine kinase n=1 Tax=Catalinimonas alkaloidigena TaxID=1075417 RepID=A0A1G9F2W2_9BACT|nr:PAS domain-containing sensor histidine kinase [Catalinimonas alkaloidigena]SDK82678.1 PAS fold-containing protein [Catalinimonas alkaloidigena]